MRSRSEKLLTAAATGFIAFAVVCVPARAQSCDAPPGTAGIEQYCESVPGPGGSGGPSDQDSRGNSTGAVGGGSGGGQGGSANGLPRQTVNGLERAGSDGASLRDFAQSGSGAGGRGAGGKQGGSGAGKVPAGASDDPLAALKSAVSSGPTTGSGYAWILLAIALLIVGLAWLRFRRPGEDQT